MHQLFRRFLVLEQQIHVFHGNQELLPPKTLHPLVCKLDDVMLGTVEDYPLAASINYLFNVLQPLDVPCAIGRDLNHPAQFLHCVQVDFMLPVGIGQVKNIQFIHAAVIVLFRQFLQTAGAL
jgi:hypothetical protein